MLVRLRAWAVFTHERKHKLYKQFAEHVTIGKEWERSVMLSLLNHQVNQFEDPASHLFSVGTYLMLPVSTVVGDAIGFQGEVAIGRAASHNQIQTAAGDMVFHVDVSNPHSNTLRVSKVVGYLSTCDGYLCLVQPHVTHGPGHWKPSGAPSLIALANILAPGIWAESDGAVRVLLPPRLHCQR